METNTIPPPAICYTWSSDTLIYQGESLAYVSPLDWEQGSLEYIIPANATLIPPPEPTAGKVIVWRDDHWEQVPDYRGKAYYDTTTKECHEIKVLGDVPADTWTDQEPTDRDAVWTDGAWVIPFDVLRQRKILQIRADADRELSAIQSNYSQSEIISWSKQETGARDLTQNPDAVSPDAVFVRAMALERGIPVPDLVEKIMGNLSPYAETMARVLGAQQRREDLVKTATKENLADI